MTTCSLKVTKIQFTFLLKYIESFSQKYPYVSVSLTKCTKHLAINFFVSLREIYFTFMVGVRKKSSENDQLTGRFQSILFNISRKKNSQTSKVNQQSVLNLVIYHHFLKNWTEQPFSTVSLSKIHRQKLKNRKKYNLTNNILSQRIK